MVHELACAGAQPQPVLVVAVQNLQIALGDAILLVAAPAVQGGGAAVQSEQYCISRQPWDMAPLCPAVPCPALAHRCFRRLMQVLGSARR